MDVHQESLAVAYVAHDHGADVTSLGAMGTRQGDLDQRLRQRPSQATHLVVGSEAGPGGSWLSRDLTPTGDPCWVVAPALMPHKAGDRVNTDRRDAVQLARLLRSGDLPPISGPTVDDAAIRALTRAREATLAALKAATVRLKAFLRRHARRDPGQAPGGPAPLRGLRDIVCPTPAQPMVFHDESRAVNAPTERLPRLEQALPDQVHAGRLHPVVEALQARRGVPCTGAVPTVAELGNLTRFHNPTEVTQKR